MLVETPPGRPAGFHVGGVAVPSQVQAVREHAAGCLVGLAGLIECTLGDGELSGVGLLLSLEQV